MFQYLKYLFQLLLSPRSGWEDISAASPAPDVLLKKGFYPLLAVTALTELFQFFYLVSDSAWSIVAHVLLDAGVYYLSVFVARYFLEQYLPDVTEPADEVNQKKLSTFIIMGMGLMVLMQMIDNCLPAHLLFLKFLPAYVVLILYKAVPYMSVARDAEMRFLGLAAVALVGLPLFVYYLLDLLI